MSIVLRAMNVADCEAGFALTQQLGWAHRREDWAQLIALGDGVVADEQGHYLGGAIGWRWGAHAATIGLVIVDRSARGRGIGQQLMLALLEKYPGCSVRLHATDMGQPLYEKLGFTSCGRIWQHQTPALKIAPPVALPPGLSLRAATPQDSAALNALDYQASGMQRDRLLHLLLDQAVVLEDAAQRLHGFASLRRFGHGFTLGPVIARDLAGAKALMAQCLQDLQGQFVRIDTPSPALAAWADSLGLQQVDAPAAMVHGTSWQAAAEGVQTFALVSPALG